MFKDILISELLPRDLSTLNISLVEGMRMFRFFGYFFLVSGLFLFSLSAFRFKMIFPSIILLLVAVMGGYMIRHVSTTVEMRKQAFINGEIVTGIVEEHGRTFNPLKSTRDYTLIIKPNNTNSINRLKVVNADKDLWISCPIGSKVIGMKYHDFYFFGEEISRRFKLESQPK